MKAEKILIVLYSITMISCLKEDPAEGPLIRQNLDRCESQEIKGEYVVRFTDGSSQKVMADSEEDLLEQIEPIKEVVDFAEPNIRLELPKAEDTIGIASSDSIHWQHEHMKTAKAWDSGIDGSGVIVAVIDSGVEVNHPQLAAAILLNENEIPDNGIDDDMNGYVDDYKGYDFHTNSGEVGDGNGHGTHVAGTIAAQHVDESSPMGVAPGAKILALAFMNSQGAGDVFDAERAIRYAVQRGANIINASWGSNTCSESLKQTIQAATVSGLLFVTAAGNNNLDLDIYQTYPTSFGLEGVLSVSASTILNVTASFSNYGRFSVEVMAPGKDIYSTYKSPDAYSVLSGTSMASPMVAGIAALAKQMQPSLSPLALKNAIISTVKAGNYPVISHGEANVENLVSLLHNQ